MFTRIVVTFVVVSLLTGCQGKAAEPATTVQAAQKLDLLTLPLPEGAEMSRHRRVAELGYAIKKGAKEAFDFVDQQLKERGWSQLPDSRIQSEFASANYELDGFLLHLSVSPRQEDKSGVIITHMGNVSLEEAPVPANAEKMYAFANVVMYKSPKSVEETAQACRQEMTKAGWSPYGAAGDSVSYRKNAVLVDVNVMSAPAQEGATVISLTSKLLSLELPAPPFADDFRYTDGTTHIGFDTDKSPQEVADFYREKLAPAGWKATTEKPVEIEWKEYTIFRTATQDMITIATHEFESRTRVNLDHQNASEVAVDELREKTSAGEKAKYRDVEWLPVGVVIPDGLESERLEDWAVKIRTPGKDAFAIAEAIAEALTAKGWDNVSKKRGEPVLRVRRYEGEEDRAVYLIAVRPPKRESWVAVVGVGGVILESEE